MSEFFGEKEGEQKMYDDYEQLEKTGEKCPICNSNLVRDEILPKSYGKCLSCGITHVKVKFKDEKGGPTDGKN